MCLSCVEFTKKAREAGITEEHLHDFLWERTAFPLEHPNDKDFERLMKEKE